jgi:hypothetical protein
MRSAFKTIFLRTFCESVKQYHTVGEKEDFKFFEHWGAHEPFSFVHLSVFDDIGRHNVLDFETTCFFTDFVACFGFVDRFLRHQRILLRCIPVGGLDSWKTIWVFILIYWLFFMKLVIKFRYIHSLRIYFIPVYIIKEFMIFNLRNIFKPNSFWWNYLT